MTAKKIQSTKNYRLFVRNTDNRPLNLKKHRKLEESMKLYGFLRCFPIVVRCSPDGSLVVKDGQHRLAIAEKLGLCVYWVEEDIDFDVAVINCTSKTWVLRDYAIKYAANGNPDYQEGLNFADQYGFSVGTAFSLLSGTTGFSNCQDKFVSGEFVIKDRKWADAVAGTYGPMTLLSSALKNVRFIEACMAVCRVEAFSSHRLLQGAERCREMLVSFSTRDAYLDMLERVYNFGRKQLVGLKALAVMAMRERSAVTNAKEKGAAKPEKQAS